MSNGISIENVMIFVKYFYLKNIYFYIYIVFFLICTFTLPSISLKVFEYILRTWHNYLKDRYLKDFSFSLSDILFNVVHIVSTEHILT